MSIRHSTAEALPKHYNYWPVCLSVAGSFTFLLAAYQFFLQPFMDGHDTAEGIAFAIYWPVFVFYLLGLAIALLYARRALQHAHVDGRNVVQYAGGCLLAAIAGGTMSLLIGPDGVGGTTIYFYWNGLAFIWIGSIVMAYLSEKWAKPLAVRDWVVYSFAMLLLPLTLVPSLPVWPVFFELDPQQTIVTAATSSFAAHFLVAHYVIFEILERRVPKN